MNALLTLLIFFAQMASAAIESTPAPKSFYLVGFAKSNAATVELKTLTGTYTLDRKQVLDLNKKYLKGFKETREVKLLVKGSMIQKLVTKPHPELAKR